MWCSSHTLKKSACGCLQPVSAGRCWGGWRQRVRETRPASTVTPPVAFPNPEFTGSSTTPPSPPKARWERRPCSFQTPICTTSPVTWRSTFPKLWACRARWRTHSWMKASPPPAVSETSFSFQVWVTQTRHQPVTDFCLDGTPPGKVVGRASDAMWIFSTGLCAVVGVMVAVGVGYQIHLDRVSKRKKLEFQYQQSKRGRLPRSLTRKPPHVCSCPKLRVHFDPCDNQKYPTWLLYFAVLWKLSFFCRNIPYHCVKSPFFFYWKTGIILIVCCHQVIKEVH